MKILEYTVRFLTPAFLGNAEQSAQWRTPPFKALLRQWWRVAYAADHGFNVNIAAMRREEGLLFGNAWLESNFSKSLVRVRLDTWENGKLLSWPDSDNKVTHPEVPQPIGAQLYLGYGPLTFRNGGTALKSSAAVQANASAVLSIAVPDTQSPRIECALGMMDRYGTVGGRSRNGWGSISLGAKNGSGKIATDITAMDWEACLDKDWPRAIGRDMKGKLEWKTGSFTDWKGLMQELARIKIGLRTQFKFTTGKDANAPEYRHWLSYPVTKHSVNAWGNNLRLPNSLRFKVREAANGQLVGVVFHMPCLPPASFQPNSKVIREVWKSVHSFLDDKKNLKRVAE